MYGYLDFSEKLELAVWGSDMGLFKLPFGQNDRPDSEMHMHGSWKNSKAQKTGTFESWCSKETGHSKHSGAPRSSRKTWNLEKKHEMQKKRDFWEIRGCPENSRWVLWRWVFETNIFSITNGTSQVDFLQNPILDFFGFLDFFWTFWISRFLGQTGLI